jgi:rRNA processing protein Krr1/Pno1
MEAGTVVILGIAVDNLDMDETVERIFEHFGRSNERLAGNAAKSRAVLEEIKTLEALTIRLGELIAPFQG